MRNEVIKRIVFDAMFLAIIAIMTFVPYLGYIQVGLISFTLVHIPVLIGAAIFGWKRGLLYGTFFGVLSLLKALSYPGTIDYLFVNPLISVLPRILFGLGAGLLFALLKRMPQLYQKGLFLAAAAFISTLFHTFLVLSALWLVYRPELEIFLHTSVSWVGFALVGLVGVGALIEAGIAALSVPMIALLVFRKYPDLAKRKETES